MWLSQLRCIFRPAEAGSFPGQGQSLILAIEVDDGRVGILGEKVQRATVLSEKRSAD